MNSFRPQHPIKPAKSAVPAGPSNLLFLQHVAGNSAVCGVVENQKAKMKPAAKASPDGNRHTKIQRMTALAYNPIYNRPHSDVVAGMTHSRVMHNNTQRQLAAWLSGYDSPADASAAGCNNCNHYIPYKWISDAVQQEISTPSALTLDHSVNWLNNLALPGAENRNVQPTKASAFPKPWSQIALGAMPVPNVPAQGAAPAHTYAENVLNREVDDLIFNLANDPRNLYYWPNSSGDGGGNQIDKPLGAGSMSVAHLKTRLSGYRTYLQGLGLNV